MRCPVCYNKIKYSGNSCSYCDFQINELNSTSNRAVRKVRKERRYDDVILTKQFPKDLDHKKTFIIAIFFGMLGFHNFYVQRNFRGAFMFGAMILGIAYAGFLTTLPENLANAYIMIPVATAAAFGMWLVDLMGIALGFYKVPAVLKKNIKRKKDEQK